MDSPLAKTLLVGSGGFVGANLRYWLGAWLQTKLGEVVPWQTLVINVSGSFLLGLFMGLAVPGQWNQGWRLFVAVGILGGYTTYSTYSYEAAKLLEDRSFGLAGLYIGGNAILSVVGAAVGMVLAAALAGKGA